MRRRATPREQAMVDEAADAFRERKDEADTTSASELSEEEKPARKVVRPVNHVCAMVTYPTHIPKDQYKRWFRETFKMGDDDIIFLEMAHENGDEECPYEHTHVVYHTKRAIISRTKAVFDYPCKEGQYYKTADGKKRSTIPSNYTPKGARERTAILNAKRYLGKEDPENEWIRKKYDYASQHAKVAKEAGNEDLSIVYSIAEDCKSKKEFFRKALDKTASNANNLDKVWEVCHIERPTGSLIDTKNFRRWQKQAYERMQANSAVEVRIREVVEDTAEVGQDIPDPAYEATMDRTSRYIQVYYGPTGGEGKTEFQKALYVSDPVKYLFLQGVPNLRDGATIIQQALEAGWSGDTIMMNLPREQADEKVYKFLEACCDGSFTSTKYKGKSTVHASRNICLFTNVMPDMGAGTVSPDRWRVYQIDRCRYPDGTLSWTPTWEKELNYWDALKLRISERDERLQQKCEDKAKEAGFKKQADGSYIRDNVH